MITVGGLSLVAVSGVHRAAFVAGRDAFAALVGVRLLDGWPMFPEAFTWGGERADTAESLMWGGYLFLDAGAGLLVGNGGFKGPPDADGVVEIGYEIAPSVQGRGLATMAALGLARFAFTRPEVRVVHAHTLAEENASNRVLRKIGMRFEGPIMDPDDGPIWRFAMTREAIVPSV